MASSFAGIEMGKRSLMAHTTAINTAGHNVSNADTEGYSRQRVQMRAFDPLYRPDLSRAETPGQVGQGMTVQDVTRVRDELLDARITAQAHQESYWSTREKYYVMLEQIYNEPAETSVRSHMDQFWQAWQELALYPDSQAARQAIVTRGDTLAGSIRQRYASLNGVATFINGDIDATVRQVNDYARQIAQVNEEIIKSQAMGDNPNDLLDRRDLLVDKLSGLVNVSADRRDADEFMVHIDGHILVQGSKFRQFAVVSPTDNNAFNEVVWADTQNAAQITGGSLGALVELRDVDVRNEMQSLNTMTMNFADMVNDIHRNAMGANGTTGLDFFVQQDFVENVNGNYDRDGDGALDSSYVFRLTGSNALAATAQTGLEGVITIAGKTGNITVPYYPTDTVETIINRINDSDGEVKAYLDRNSNLVLKATTASDAANPDFVIRHVEDSGHFLSGYAGVLAGRGAENAYDFNQPDAVARLAANAQYAVSPMLNPAAYITVNGAIRSDVLSVAAAYPSAAGSVEPGDSSAASQIASLRNTPVMIGRSRTFDDYFAESVTNVGLKGEQAQNMLAQQNVIMGDLRNLRESISGVNIDEELADIIKFQHGYNAAARFISVMDELLDTVINRLGV
ncbi:MAG TPA: flagellar hook-associated protein FlgK [Candidatus Treponema faecavium]|nr:flagellar hook-associated protein FlgK [Candidatus Treponema faecavium]